MLNDKTDNLLSSFSKPGAAYRPAPLWVWNDEMRPEEIRSMLRELASHGFGGAFVHPRPGLVTEYLSEAWFALWGEALDEAGRLGLKLYIYDENSYPSGFAGGHIPSELPDCLATSVLFKEYGFEEVYALSHNSSPMLNKPGHPIRAFAMRRAEDGLHWVVARDVTLLPALEWEEYGEQFWLFELGVPETNRWLGGFAYADLLRPEVTEKFINVTHEQYRKHFGDRFGSQIPALFTDEPEISPGNLFEAGDRFLPFSYWFAGEFEKFNGYDLRDYLPCLFRDVQFLDLPVDPVKVRYDYYCTIRQLWVTNSVKPISDWCERHGLAYTGHYLEHQWPHPFHRTSPAIMSMYEYMHWPAIDMLETKLLKKDGSEQQLLIGIREAQSAANQFERDRVLCEAYGAGGWDSTFEDYKRIGDWLYVHGINFLNQHLTYSTIAGARKRDHPQSFDWRQPWWDEYSTLNDYFGRLSYALSQGKTVNRILLVNPTTSSFLLTPKDLTDNTNYRQGLDETLELVQTLADHQWDYDLGDEFIMESQGGVGDSGLRVGKREYDIVILPPAARNLKQSTLNLLSRFLANGGTVLAMGEAPERIDGSLNDAAQQLSYHPGWVNVNNAEAVLEALTRQLKPRAWWHLEGGSLRGLAHLRREIGDGSAFYFIVNSGPEQAVGTLTFHGNKAEIWNLIDGVVSSVTASPDEQEGIALSVHLNGSESMLVRVFEQEASADKISSSLKELSIQRDSPRIPCSGSGTMAFPEHDNVLPILYCDLQVGTKHYEGIHTIHAARFAFEHHGFETNPWDNAIQYKRRLLDRNAAYGGQSGFIADFHFELGDLTESDLISVTVERPELYRISVNGHPVTISSGTSRLDRHMGTGLIGHALRKGRNTVRLEASPFSIFMEIEPIYINGNFAVTEVDGRWVINRSVPFGIGSWRENGYPFYGDAVRYRKTFTAPANGKKVWVSIPRWCGTVISVNVNGQNAGLIGLDSARELDITKWIHSGQSVKENELELRVSGNFRNLLGPHFDPTKPRNLAWPGAWKRSPIFGPPSIQEYDLLDYGILEEITLLAEA